MASFIHLLNDLIELDYDAIEAYQAAIERIHDERDRAHLGRFTADHRRHVTELTAIVEQLGGKPKKGADLRRILTKGKVVIGGLIGDRSVLMAMKSNEDDTNAAYERATRQAGLPEHVCVVLQSNLADERRHREWLEQRIAMGDQPPTHP